MADPKNSFNEGEKRYYLRGDRRYASVTTILQATPKPLLTRWAARCGADFVLKNLDWIVERFLAKTPEAKKEIQDAIIQEHEQVRDRAAFIGTQAHELTEGYDYGIIDDIDLSKFEPETHPFLETYKKFVLDFEPKPVLIEATVFSDKYSYAGTLDRCVEIADNKYLLDIKTGKSVHPDSVALQLAAYRYADYILTEDDTETPIPEVAGGLVLHLRPNGYKLYPVQCDEAIFQRFLTCLSMFNWHNFESKKVLGMALRPEDFYKEAA